MIWRRTLPLLLLVAAAVLAPALPAQAQPPPLFATTKVTDNVYIFRYGGHQSMFVVTPEGVIATDPIAYRRPQAAVTYLAEIRKITSAPVKYVIYSHHHYDHIEGGKPFKDAGATFLAHRVAKARLEALRNPDVVPVDVGVGNKHVIHLGGTRLELYWVGRNHSDNSLVMLLPDQKLAFAVDFIPFESVQFRDMPDGYLPDFFDSLDNLLKLNWDRLIPGHPYAGGRLGTKDDVIQHRQYLQDLSDAVKQAALAGKCFDDAIKEIKLPKYEKWANYDKYLPGNIERFCEFWGRGY
ncbi:MAG: MBL fold metallo-hydrolase, partial [Candidatus Rokubacteria bacterium]|nr:MBL fold metallo-hydrolase [Candidatus Rokubacteria bacterium]